MGRKLRSNSTKLKGIRRSGPQGNWIARKVIPADLQPVFGKKEFWASLGTTDENIAIARGAPLLSDWSSQIDRARASRNVLMPAPGSRAIIQRDEALRAVERWRIASIRQAYDDHFNDLITIPAPMSAERVALSDLRERLTFHRFDEIADFYDRFAAALQSGGIGADAGHPALQKMTREFGAAWLNVEANTERFRSGLFDVAVPEAPAPVAVPAATPSKPAGMKLLALFDLWESSKGKSEKRHRGYVQRLSEYLGDPDIDTITPLQLDAFLVELRRFPNTKRPVDDVPFLTLIERAQKWDDYRTLHVKTVWNWTVVFKGMFEFALDRDLIRKNPAAKTMRKPSAEESEERSPYEADDIEAIFKAPLFTGFTGNGYREKPGSTVIRDHKYWLPILALWTGGRVDELATLDASEIKTQDGVAFIDLTERPLKGPRRVKNRSARRIIPVHDRLIALGFLKHVAASKGGPIFTELDMTDDKVSASFTKWWGRWCEVNAATKGQGIDDPAKVFHSFRHAWKRTARMSDAKEEIHDLISGHTDGNAVARGYGRGVDLKTLKAAMDQIHFPSFKV